MNNLVLALIAIGFATVLMFAGVSYMSTNTTTSIKVASDSIADVQHLVGDYENLKINLGRSPTGADFQAIYANNSNNAHYVYTSDPAFGVLATKVASIPGASPLGSTAAAGWTYLPASVTKFNLDIFCVKINNNGPSAKAIYQAAKQAAKKEMMTKGFSQISLGTYAPGVITVGCGGTSNTDPASWPAVAPTTYYLTTQMSPENLL